PVCKLNPEEQAKCNYFSDKYIYTCDIFYVRSSAKDEGKNPNLDIHFGFVKSIILKSSSPSESKENLLDDIFSNCPYNNKFAIQSGNILSFNSKFIFNVLYEKFVSEAELKVKADTAEELFSGSLSKDQKAIML